MKKLSIILTLAGLCSIGKVNAMYGPTAAYLRAGFQRAAQLARRYPLATTTVIGGAGIAGLIKV